MQTADAQTEANHNRRMANEARYIDRQERLAAMIERQNLIGELCREGRTVYYFFPAGAKKSFEDANWFVVADHIIKLGYVR